MARHLLRIMIMCACSVVAGCGYFDYHPYDSQFYGLPNINDINAQFIQQAMQGRDTIRFALMSDTHLWHSQAKDIVNSINMTADVDFVIHGGDLTDCGTTPEYEQARDILARLRYPFVALLGNHDCLGSGYETFRSMFGSDNFAFVAGRVKFVCLNTNSLEFAYAPNVPDMQYLADQSLLGPDYDRTVVCMHVRPSSEGFNNVIMQMFHDQVARMPGLLFCINGHDHHLQEDDLFGDGIMYYGADCALHRSYILFTIYPDRYEYEVVEV